MNETDRDDLGDELRDDLRDELRDDLDSDEPAAENRADEALLDELASHLLWRIGRTSDDGPVTVRVGLATSAPLFQQLPRLRSASDAEVEAAVQSDSVKVEWVGPKPRAGGG